MSVWKNKYVLISMSSISEDGSISIQKEMKQI